MRENIVGPKLRAWWCYKQGLDGRFSGKPAAEVLEQAGWARSVGGVNPYLTLFSRAGISRKAADGAVANLEIHELPCARGCTYVVPASDFALALKAGQADSTLSAEEAYTELARRFFTWIGPATLAEFNWFSGLGAKAAKAAVASLRLQPVGDEDTYLMFPADYEAYQAYQPPREPHYALVSTLDGIMHLRRNVRDLVAPEDSNRQVFAEKGLTELSGLTDLTSHAIVDRGRLVGLWEYDTVSEAIAWTSFIPRNAELEAAVRRTEAFVREDLGDARSFSLDTPKSRAGRIEGLRKM